VSEPRRQVRQSSGGPPHVLLWGVDHHRAGTALREQVALDGDRASIFLEGCRASGLWPVVLLATCNRSEIYLESDDLDAAADKLRVQLKSMGLDPDIFEGEHGCQRRDRDAIEHLYRLTAGLESMMLGEPQIAGQVREAWRRSQEQGPLGSVLDRAFRGAFKASKCVRTTTRLGKGAVSVAFAAVEVSRKFYEQLGKRRGVLLGAGETGALAGRHFVDAGLGELAILNRTRDKAEHLAGILGRKGATRCTGMGFEQLNEALIDADLLLCSTASPEPLIRAEQMQDLLKRRKGKPLCIIDIAVPRDVEAAVGRLPEVFLFGLDDLGEIVRANLSARRQEMPRVEKILAGELGQFDRFLQDLELRPTLGSFHSFLQEIKNGELERQKCKVSAETHAVIEASLHTFVQRVMYHPSRQLRQDRELDVRDGDLASLRRLFDLDVAGPDGEAPTQLTE
jgi:glutamyl-tRNA reductase